MNYAFHRDARGSLPLAVGRVTAPISLTNVESAIWTHRAVPRSRVCGDRGGQDAARKAPIRSHRFGHHLLLAPPFILEDHHIGALVDTLGDAVDAIVDEALAATSI